MLEQIVIGAYTAVNSLRVFSYLPQIASVTRARDRVEAISLVTWTLWTISNVTTSIYGALIVHDQLLMVIFAANAACCAVVITIVVWKRKRVCSSSSTWRR